MIKEIPATGEGISAAVSEIAGELKSRNTDSRISNKVLLASEEILNSLISLPGAECLSYEIVERFRKKQVVLSCKGPRFETAVDDSALKLDLDEIGDETGECIRRIVLKSLSGIIHCTYRKGTNYIGIDFSQKKVRNPVILAILSAVVAGFLCRFLLPAAVSGALCSYVLSPVSGIMLSLLQLIIGPMVFFSIATSLSQYANPAELGRIGGKVLLTYLSTSVIAVFFGFVMSGIFAPGIAGSFSAAGTQAEAVSMSLLDSLLDIFPSNAVQAFYNSNMLQIIVLAVLIGLSLTRLKLYREPVMTFFNGINEVISEMMTLLSKGIPLLAFTSLCNVIISTGGESLLSALQIVVTVYGSYVVMICVYMLLLRIFAKLSPLTFFKKHFPYMLNAAAIMSSNASIPQSMKECEELGVPRKLFSFSIPLGATINMDGMSISSVILALACAKMCGLEALSLPAMLNLGFTILMLSMATPGVPGVACASEVVLISVLGLPMEILPLMITVVSLSDMGDTANNVTGDVVASVIVAAREKLLDRDRFNSKN